MSEQRFTYLFSCESMSSLKCNGDQLCNARAGLSSAIEQDALLSKGLPSCSQCG